MKLFKNSLSYLFVCSLLFTFSCKKDRNKGPYKGCCETEALVEKVDSGSIYVPNVFTPNADGFNDVFLVFGGTGIEKVISFTIRSTSGVEWFSKSDFLPTEYAEGWDGTFNGKLREGLFAYELEVKSTKGNTFTFNGEACSLLCNNSFGETEALISEENTPNCNFPSQHDGNGGLDTVLPPLENSACFGK